MSLLSTDELRAFDETLDRHRLSFLIDLMERYPSTEQAKAGVTQLLAHPLFQIPDYRFHYSGEWLSHDWLVTAVHFQRTAWAKALLDQGVNASLMIPEGDWGGGQALREALDQKNADPELLEQLWQRTDMKAMIQVLTHRIERTQRDGNMGWFSARYTHHVDCVAARHARTPELTEALAALVTLTGEENLPLYQKQKATSTPDA
jgi:hypothetical protein